MQIELALPHTHAGREYSAGAVLDLDPDTAEWLIAQGVAVPRLTPVTDVVPGLVPMKSPSAPRAVSTPERKPK